MARATLTKRTTPARSRGALLAAFLVGIQCLIFSGCNSGSRNEFDPSQGPPGGGPMLGIPFLDLTPQLRESEDEKGPLFHKYDEHMTGEGYRLAGSTIYGWWSREAAAARSADEAPPSGRP